MTIRMIAIRAIMTASLPVILPCAFFGTFAHEILNGIRYGWAEVKMELASYWKLMGRDD